jgi:Cu/Ag efflux pump CusA
MMLDQDNLRPVIIAMTLYITLLTIVPRVIKKPTGVQVIDDLVMTMIAQKGSMMSGTILIGLIVLATNYIQDELL